MNALNLLHVENKSKTYEKGQKRAKSINVLVAPDGFEPPTNGL